MFTVSRGLPERPHLDVPKQQARELLKQCKSLLTEALDRVRRQHPRYKESASESIASGIKLNEAQFVIAREYGFASWSQLKERISHYTIAEQIDRAIRSNDSGTVTRLLTAYPGLLHVPVRSGNWGPPMSHAANMGLPDMVKTIAALGAKDFQHAFDRALLHGDIEIAKWLFTQGAELTPGIIMGSCETLNDRGFAFLLDAGAPLADGQGNRLAPLAMVLETYSRYPERKHAILNQFKTRGYTWPDSPIMAFHTGDLQRLRHHAKMDPELIHRRFTYREIYPPELGCADDGLSGLHGTPVHGTTLLHLSIDFDEREIFDWLLAQGADVNARALVDAEGFGGHTPLFNALVSDAYVCGWQRDAYMVQSLIERKADVHQQASLRKFLDWREDPGWHTALRVTPLEWAASFPERGWVNQEGVRMIEKNGYPDLLI